MSKSAYISEVQADIAKSITSYEKYAADHPYPVDELAKVIETEPDSAIAQAYGKLGRKVDVSLFGQLAGYIMQQDKVLGEALRLGDKGLKKLARAKKLKAITSEDISKDLNLKYSNYLSALYKLKSLGSTKINDKFIGETLQPDKIEDFEDYYRHDSISTFIEDPDHETIQAAYKEFWDKRENEQIDETAAPINDTDTITDEDEEGGPLNDGENPYEQTGNDAASAESIPSDVITDGSELPEEIPAVEEASKPAPINVEVNLSEIPTGSAAINDTQLEEKKPETDLEKIQATYKDMSMDEVLADIDNSVSSVNTSINEKMETNSVFKEWINTLNTETTTPKLDKDGNPIKTDPLNTKETIQDNSYIEKTTEERNREFVDQGGAVLEEMQKAFGWSDEEIDKQVAVNKDARLNKESEAPGLPEENRSSNIEVDHVAPVLKDTDTIRETKSVDTDTIKENTSSNNSIKVIESKEGTASKSSESKEAMPAAPAPVVNMDMSALDARLSRIEYALSNTLEVKIVD